MRSFRRVGYVLALVILVAGCSEDEEPTAEPKTSFGCDEGTTREQLVAARFTRTDPASPELGALLGRFFDEDGRPCANVDFELPKGWSLDHYTLRYRTWLFEGSLTKKEYDGGDPFLRAEADDCARYSAEIVLRRGDRIARYVASTRYGPVCTPPDASDVETGS